MPLVAHEVCHIWIGTAIEFFDEQEYWFMEGFTDYYSEIISVRLGLLSEADFFKNLGRICESYLRQAGTLSMREAGADKMGNSGLVYCGGGLVAAALDVQIRKLTHVSMGAGQKSLDDVMKQMYQEFGTTDEKYTIDDVIRIEVNAQNDFYLLPTPVVFDKEWTAIRINGAITLKLKIQSPDFQIPGGDRANAIPIALVEKGKVVGTETVKTPAGTFEDCVKIEYWMEDDREARKKAKTAKPTSSDVSDVETSTLWLASNVGIVKFVRKSTTSKVEKSLELTQYEIVSTDLEGK